MKTLLDAQKDEIVTILSVNETNINRSIRFAKLGLIAGERVKVLMFAPKRSSILIGVRGYCLALDSLTCRKVAIYD